MKYSTLFIYRFFPALFLYIMSIGVVLPRGSIATQIAGSLFLLFTAYYFALEFVQIKIFNPILLYLVYTAFLVLFSSNVLYSISNWSATTIWILILPLSFYVINSLEKFKKLINSISFLAILYILNILLSTFVGIQGKSYSGEIFDVGNVFTEGLNSMAYLIIASPLISYLNPNYRRVILILTVIIFILVLVQLKRISILAIGIGILVNIFYSGNRVNIVFGLIISALLFFVALPIFENALTKQLKARERRLSTQNIEEEGRYQETLAVYDEIIMSNKVSLLLFGKEVYNSPGNYANGKYGKRMIHNDYNAVLHGSGILGLALFIFWPISLLLFYRKIIPFAKISFEDKRLFDYMNMTFISFIIIGYVLSFSGGVNAILFNAVRVAVMGACLRIFYEHYYRLKNNTSLNAI